MRRSLTLPAEIEAVIVKEIEALGFSLNKPLAIADSILHTSDHYIHNPSATTTWEKRETQVAQLAYYLPLNFLRNSMVIAEGEKQKFFPKNFSLVEFGSGLAPSTMAFAKQNLGFQQVHLIERSSIAQKYSQNLLQSLYPDRRLKLHQQLPNDFQNTVGVFSYSLTELQNLPDWAETCSHLMLIEPSTQTDARKLMELRQALIENGYHIYAPCTHQGLCPLLSKSKSDWCHDRVEIKMPDWWMKLDALLPMKNSTITWSYLLASKIPPKDITTGLARAVGDVLPDKGKQRAMICQSERREFLTRLSRFGDLPQIDRGDLLQIIESEAKGDNELRIKQESDIKVLPRPYAW